MNGVPFGIEAGRLICLVLICQVRRIRESEHSKRPILSLLAVTSGFGLRSAIHARNANTAPQIAKPFGTMT
jgi:hypothetical protein